MSNKQQELDQRIATLKEWLAEYKINEIKFPTTRPPIKTPSAPRPAGTTAEIPAATKPGAAGAEELVLGPGGKYYAKGEVPSEADILARQAAVDRAAAEQAKRAGKGEPSKSAAEIPPGIRITGGEPVHPIAFEPAPTKPQVSTGIKDPKTGKDIMRPMTDAEIRAAEAEAIQAGKASASAADTAAKSGKTPFWTTKKGIVTGIGLGLASGLGANKYAREKLGYDIRQDIPYVQQIDVVGDIANPNVSPEQHRQTLDRLHPVQPAPAPAKPEAAPTTTTTAPPVSSIPSEPPFRRESFDRLQELAGIAKKTL